jgi:hypothetical protein
MTTTTGIDSDTGPAPRPDSAPAPRTGGGLVRAAAFGLGVAGLGVLADAGLGEWVGSRLAFVPWLIGLGVGLAVRRGRGRGGLAGQVLALALTYAAVVAGHVAALPAEARAQLDASPEALLFVAGLPLLKDVNGVFGLAMILLGLLQAWRLNRAGLGDRHAGRVGA